MHFRGSVLSRNFVDLKNDNTTIQAATKKKKMFVGGLRRFDENLAYASAEIYAKKEKRKRKRKVVP